MKTTNQQMSCILAGLRLLQEKVDEIGAEAVGTMAHFADVEPMTVEQLDEFAEQICCGDVIEPEQWVDAAKGSNYSNKHLVSVHVERGMVRDVFTDHPALNDATCLVIDYDNDGNEPDHHFIDIQCAPSLAIASQDAHLPAVKRAAR